MQKCFTTLLCGGERTGLNIQGVYVFTISVIYTNCAVYLFHKLPFPFYMFLLNFDVILFSILMTL